MKFTISKSQFEEVLQIVLNAIPSKTTLPILGNILVNAGENEITFSATDLDISVSTTLNLKPSKKGIFTIPAKTINDIVRELPQSEIEIEVNNNRIELKAERGTYKVSGISPDEFPRLPEYKKAKEIKISGKDISRMIRKTQFSVSTDETRPALNGIMWQTAGDKMVMVATDGHRLARMRIDNPKLTGLTDDLIIPPKAMNYLTRLIGDKDAEIGIVFGDKNITFSIPKEDNTATVISSRLIEGPYPNYDQVIPTDNDKRMIVNREELHASVRRVAILSNSLTHQVRFVMDKNNLELSATNVDLGGEAKEILPCEYEGERLELGYNASYVTDVLKQIDSDEVVFELSTPVAAGIIFAADRKEDYLCLIMPLRLAE
jgi:DNA polymerase III subunit beta